MLPYSELDFVITNQLAFSVLLSVEPASDIGFSIGPFILSLAVELVVLELSDILHPVWPYKRPKPIHFVIFPAADILFLILPNIGAFSLDVS